MAYWVLVLILLSPLSSLAPVPQGPGLKTRQQQRNAILKEDHEKSLKDVAEILTLAKELEEELDKNKEHIIDIRTLRKAERIEDLARNVKNRMRRMF